MRPTRAALLLFVDGRTPTGGHAHSGGVEAAVVAGDVTTVDELDAFLRGRLTTTGNVTATFAAAACAVCGERGERGEAETVGGNGDGNSFEGEDGRAGGDRGAGRGQVRDKSEDHEEVLDTLAYLDEELDARTPSPAQRSASRALGRSLLRTARTAWPGLRSPHPAPHHPIALGVAAGAAGLAPLDAALAAAYAAVSGPASAATRLLGLDPLAVTALLARLAPDVDGVASTAAASATRAAATPTSVSGVGYRSLPALTAVRLDLLAEAHRRAEVRMFAS